MTSPLHDAGCTILESIVEELVSPGVPKDGSVYHVQHNVMIELVEPDGTVR